MLLTLTITQVPPDSDDQIVAAQHLVDFAGDVGRVHWPLAGFLARTH